MADIVPAAEPRQPKRPVDWSRVEMDYRAGLLSLRELSAQHDVSHVSIKKHADKAGWTRDLNARIRAKADELVNRAQANKSANRTDVVSERQIIEANGERIAYVHTSHRASSERARILAVNLLSELEGQCADPALLGQLGELMRSPGEDGADRLNDIYKKVISTPGRVDTAKKLIETMKSVVSMEREAYGIDALPVANPTDSLTAFLLGMKRSALPVVQEVGRDEHL